MRGLERLAGGGFLAFQISEGEGENGKDGNLMNGINYVVRPIGIIRSELKSLEEAPCRWDEGAPEAWLEVAAPVMDSGWAVAAKQAHRWRSIFP